MAFAFEKLIVYQKSIDFADSICQQTEKFARGYRFLVDQLNRAALSIAANIAVGNGRFTGSGSPQLLRHCSGVGPRMRAAFGAGAATQADRR